MDREGYWPSHEKAVTNWFKRNYPECFHCGKTGHIKHNYHLVSGEKKRFRLSHHGKQKANKASVVNDYNSGNRSGALMVSHKVLSASHLCCDSELFDKLETMKHSIHASIGDGKVLKAEGLYFWIWNCQVRNGMSADCLIFCTCHCYLILYRVFLR